MICKKCGEMVKRLTKSSHMCETCKKKSEKLRHLKAMRTRREMGWKIKKLPTKKEVLRLISQQDTKNQLKGGD